VSGRRLLGPLAAGLVVGAYAGALRRYGVFEPADEGVLLVQAWRVVQGQSPYVDFHTGYGPAYFHLQALLLSAGGLAAVRTALAGAQAATAALLYALARRLAGPALAAAAVALEVAFFLPLAPGRGAPFNVPYPAWYAGLGGVAVVALLAHERPPALVRIGLAGAICGLVAAMKPNSGVLLALGVTAMLALQGRPGWTVRVLLALVVAAAVLVVAPAGLAVAAVVLLSPVVGLALVRPEGLRDPAAPVAVLLVGFAAVVLAAFTPILAALGAARFAHDVLLLGAGVTAVYGIPVPWPAALATVVGVAAFAFRERHPRLLAAAAAAGVLALAVARAGAHAPAVASAVRIGAEDAALVAIPLVLWGALAAVRGGNDRTLAGATAIATVAMLQLHPRPDFIHLMPLGALLVPLGVRVWRDAARTVVGPRVAAGVLVAAAVVRFIPAAAVLGHVVTGRVVTVKLGRERLVIEPDASGPLRAIAAAAGSVASALPAAGRVLVFPACGLVPFVARRLPAGPHDYFFPGRPDRAEVAALTARLAADPPALAVTCTGAGTRLADAWTYYPELVEFLGARYRPRESDPPYEVLVADGTGLGPLPTRRRP
jgi:hypothetical protein